MPYSPCSLLGDFYSVAGLAPDDGGFTATVALNVDHAIYGGHFPGSPVTPGVCVLQIAKELIERHLGAGLRLSVLKNVKFLQAIAPGEYPQVFYTVSLIRDQDRVAANITVGSGGAVFVKISAQYDING